MHSHRREKTQKTIGGRSRTNRREGERTRVSLLNDSQQYESYSRQERAEVYEFIMTKSKRP